jgi:hypothetical protein
VLKIEPRDVKIVGQTKTVTVDPINNKPFLGVYPVSGTGHYQANLNGGGLKSYGGSGSPASGGGSASGGSAAGGSAAAGG